MLTLNLRFILIHCVSQIFAELAQDLQIHSTYFACSSLHTKPKGICCFGNLLAKFLDGLSIRNDSFFIVLCPSVLVELCICSIQTYRGVTGLTTPPPLVWRGQVWYFHPLGSILRAKCWIGVVLVSLERAAKT